MFLVSSGTVWSTYIHYMVKCLWIPEHSTYVCFLNIPFQIQSLNSLHTSGNLKFWAVAVRIFAHSGTTASSGTDVGQRVAVSFQIHPKVFSRVEAWPPCRTVELVCASYVWAWKEIKVKGNNNKAKANKVIIYNCILLTFGCDAHVPTDLWLYTVALWVLRFFKGNFQNSRLLDSHLSVVKENFKPGVDKSLAWPPGVYFLFFIQSCVTAGQEGSGA